MNSFPRFAAFLRRVRPHFCLTGIAVALGSFHPAAPALADQVDSHDALVQQLVQQQHASPLVADCAAHAAFVVPTNPLYDHVEFLPSALDDQHATTESWDKPFDDRKQRISVDTVISVNGLGYRKGAGENSQPDLLKFRCGYVADKLLAFGWNEPALAAPARVAGGRHGGRGHHAVRHGRGNAHGATHAAHGSAVSHGSHKATSAHGKTAAHKSGTAKKHH